MYIDSPYAKLIIIYDKVQNMKSQIFVKGDDYNTWQLLDRLVL